MTRPTVTFPAAECHRSLTSSKLQAYYMVTWAQGCVRLVQSRYAAVTLTRVEPVTSWCKSDDQPAASPRHSSLNTLSSRVNYLFILLFIYSPIHIKLMPQQKQLETSKTTVWTKWLAQGNAT